jgi:hypothetical protein
VIPGPWVIIQAGLVVLGFYWCVIMFRRWRTDLAEFRSTRDRQDKAVIASLWLVTALLGTYLVTWAVGIVGAIRHGAG